MADRNDVKLPTHVGEGFVGLRHSMRVLTLLESLPALGKVKARRLLDQIGISESRRIQGLGAKQRAELLRVTAR